MKTNSKKNNKLNNKIKTKRNDKKVEIKKEPTNKFSSIFTKIKELLLNKKFLIITAVIILIIVIIIILMKSFKKEEEKFALNEIYDVYPEQVRKLYSNIIELSCQGDLHLNIKLDEENTSVEKLDKKTLLDYLFSNIEKTQGLTDKIETSLITQVQDRLFRTDINLLNSINNYQYGNYIYTKSGDTITRKEAKCQSDIEYVTFLYGYSWNKDKLSMDVNISYLKEGTLYDLNNKVLGSYDGDASKLFDLTKDTSFYRFNYVKEGSEFKLDSVKWMSRS